MRVFKILKSPDRNPTIDVFRAAAILMVVLYHFDYTIYMGSMGVDLFFVISGFLVGGLLLKDYDAGSRINFATFFLKRGFKIWPSYYFFLLLGGIIGYALFVDSQPELMPSNWFKYIFFYKNYITDNEWIFGHAWSLCVEEHFYIILPLIFLVIQRYGNFKSLVISLTTLILIGNISKVLTFYLSESQETYFATHNRLDALAWGVLLKLWITSNDFVERYRYKLITFFITAILFLILIKLYFVAPEFFKKVVFRATVPVFFAILIASLYYVDLSFLKPLRLIAYYSYNWYLWHPIVAVLVSKYLGTGTIGLAIYLAVSFLMAVIFTAYIEQPFLKLRQRVFPTKALSAKPVTAAASCNPQ